MSRAVAHLAAAAVTVLVVVPARTAAAQDSTARQAPASSYGATTCDTSTASVSACALRLRWRPFSGDAVVRGDERLEVARAGRLGLDLAPLVGRSPEAAALAARSRRLWRAAALLGGGAMATSLVGSPQSFTSPQLWKASNIATAGLLTGMASTALLSRRSAGAALRAYNATLRPGAVATTAVAAVVPGAAADSVPCPVSRSYDRCALRLEHGVLFAPDRLVRGVAPPVTVCRRMERCALGVLLRDSPEALAAVAAAERHGRWRAALGTGAVVAGTTAVLSLFAIGLGGDGAVTVARVGGAAAAAMGAGAVVASTAREAALERALALHNRQLTR